MLRLPPPRLRDSVSLYSDPISVPPRPPCPRGVPCAPVRSAVVAGGALLRALRVAVVRSRVAGWFSISVFASLHRPWTARRVLRRGPRSISLERAARRSFTTTQTERRLDRQMSTHRLRFRLARETAVPLQARPPAAQRQYSLFRVAALPRHRERISG